MRRANQEVGREEGAESPWVLHSGANGDVVKISPSDLLRNKGDHVFR